MAMTTSDNEKWRERIRKEDKALAGAKLNPFRLNGNTLWVAPVEPHRMDPRLARMDMSAEIFANYDYNGDGQMDVFELKAALRDLQMPLSDVNIMKVRCGLFFLLHDSHMRYLSNIHTHNSLERADAASKRDGQERRRQSVHTRADGVVEQEADYHVGLPFRGPYEEVGQLASYHQPRGQRDFASTCLVDQRSGCLEWSPCKPSCAP